MAYRTPKTKEDEAKERRKKREKERKELYLPEVPDFFEKNGDRLLGLFHELIDEWDMKEHEIVNSKVDDVAEIKYSVTWHNTAIFVDCLDKDGNSLYHDCITLRVDRLHQPSFLKNVARDILRRMNYEF